MTSALLDEITAWQARRLAPVYPLIFLNTLRIEVRSAGALTAL